MIRHYLKIAFPKGKTSLKKCFARLCEGQNRPEKCFAQMHEDCKYASTPKTNTEFWNDKITSNVERDKINV
jgi:hypothetical protein